MKWACAKETVYRTVAVLVTRVGLERRTSLTKRDMLSGEDRVQPMRWSTKRRGQKSQFELFVMNLAQKLEEGELSVSAIIVSRQAGLNEEYLLLNEECMHYLVDVGERSCEPTFGEQ